MGRILLLETLQFERERRSVFDVPGSMFRVQSCLLLLMLATVALGGEETNAPVRALGDGRFAVGLVTLDKNGRSISFPATVNLREETIEYVVVHKTGKAHESIFRTDTRPQDIHLAMLLLNVQPAMTNWFGIDGKAPPKGDKVWIEAAWSDLFARHQVPVEDLVLNKETSNTLALGEWIYNGSNFSEGMFTAQRDGSIVSIHIDPDALINNPRPGRENDDLYRPHAERLPPIGTKVVLTIKLQPPAP
jgi:hypothetical protein